MNDFSFEVEKSKKIYDACVIGGMIKARWLLTWTAYAEAMRGLDRGKEGRK